MQSQEVLFLLVKKTNNKLGREFFIRDTLTVAKDLLGKFLIKDGFVVQINEVEAYIGDCDPACHAFIGKTERNKAMFEVGGTAYIYFIYGMYFCFNVVTEEEGRGCAILVRGAKVIKGVSAGVKTDGPGKLCRALGITKVDDGRDLCSDKSFYLCDRAFKPTDIRVSKRIGLTKGVELEWRFSCSI